MPKASQFPHRALRGLLAAAVLACAGSAAFAAEPLKICASKKDVPYSIADGSGFENRIAAVLAQAMGREAQFVWTDKPAIYLVRDFLDKQQCDVVMGMDTGDDRVLTTDAYYRSGYVFVTLYDRGLDITSWKDPRIQEMSHFAIGFNSPAEVMLKTIGSKYEDNAAYVYSLVGFRSPRNQYVQVDPSRMVAEVEQGHADAAVAFGPEVARYVHASPVALRMTMLSDDNVLADGRKVPHHFSQSVGVRKDDADLAAALNAALAKAKPQIDEILKQEGIPLLAEAS